MKKFYLFIAMLLTAAFFAACQNPAGYDDNAVKEPVIDEKDTLDIDNKKAIEALESDFMFFEQTPVGSGWVPYPMLQTRKNIKLDTSRGAPLIFIDIHFKSAKRDNEFSELRADRLEEISIQFAAIAEPGFPVFFSPNRNDKKWAVLKIRHMKRNGAQVINAAQLRGALVIQAIHPERGMIEGSFKIDLQNMKNIHTKQILCKFMIRYK